MTDTLPEPLRLAEDAEQWATTPIAAKEQAHG